MRRAAIFLAVALIAVSCSPAEDSGAANSTTSTTGAAQSTVPPSTTMTTPSTTSTTAGTTTTSEPEYDVVLEGGTAEIPEVTVNGPAVFEFLPGDAVEITVLSSVDDEIHLHGYDLYFDARVGEVTVIDFVADVPGIFEVELETTHLLLFEIEVSP